MRISPRFLFGAAIAVVGLLAGAFFWNRAFPTAALQFAITESAAEAKARAFLKSAGYDLKGYVATTNFGEDSTEKNYIEKEYGLRTMEAKVREGINLWYWTTRFFKPEQEEEFSIAYDPQGRFVGLFHTIPENAAAPFLTREQARVVAEEFLKRHVTHHPFDKLKLVEDNFEKLPKRTDYTFTWEQDDLRLGDATYQLHITVQGDKVGRFNENLKVPEAWQRSFSTQRSLNGLFQQIAGYASTPIYLGAFVLFVMYVMRGRIRWTTAVPTRWFVLYALVELAAAINNIPEILSDYSTTDKLYSFLFTQANETLHSIVYAVLGFYLFSIVADALYREQLPDKLPFAKAMGKGSLCQPETVRALGVGIVLACFGIGYVCTFYVVATRFGAWSPVDIDYSKIIGGPIPWIGGIQVGISAAWLEEFIFRILGILLYWKLLTKIRLGRFKWIGLVLAGATWAFLHSNYPQMPGYLRGCELTVEGILWGVIMVRYGIVATLTGHYLYDCWLSSLIVFQSADPLNKLGALLVSFWPIALWLIGLYYQRVGKAAPVDEPESEQPNRWFNATAALPSWNFGPLVLTQSQRLLLLLTAVLSALAVFVLQSPPNPMKRFGHLTLSRSQIAQAADQVMRDHGQDPGQYRRLLTLQANSTSHRYLLEYGTPDEVADLFDSEWSDLTWSVRYFRFMQKQEFSLALDKDGKLVRWRHAIPREAAGPSLEKAAALELAKKYLAEKHGVDFSNEKLIEDELRQQVKRRDYTFTWQRQDWDWGDSELRTQIVIQGDEPVGYSRYVKVPDEWYREEAKKSSGWKDAILKLISEWSSLALTVGMAIAFIYMLQHDHIPWKAGFLLALAPTALRIVEKLNDLPWFYSGYSTTKPYLHFIAQKIGNELSGIFFYWISNGLRLSVAIGLMSWAFGWKLRLLHWPKWDWPTLRRSASDFFPLLLVSLSLLWVTDFFQTWLYHVTAEKARIAVQYPGVNYSVPWLAGIIDALQGGYDKVLGCALLGTIGVILYRRWPWLVWTLLAAYPLYSALHVDTVHEYVQRVAMNEFRWLIGFFLLWKLWRFDAALIFATAALSGLLPEIRLFIQKGGPAYQSQAWPLVLTAVVLIALAWWLRPAATEPSTAVVATDEENQPSI